MKPFAAILILAVGTLLWALYSLQDSRRQMAAQQEINEVVIFDFSNRWDTTRRTLDEQKSFIVVLETNLTQRARHLDSLRQEIADLHAELAKGKAETTTARAELAIAQAEIDKASAAIVERDARIESLEARHAELAEREDERRLSLSDLERRLADAEGDRLALLDRLEYLRTENGSLEQRLEDLASLPDRVRQLRQELTVARRLEWIRRSVDSPLAPRMDGSPLAESKLAPPVPEPAAPPAQAPQVDSPATGEASVEEPTANSPDPR